MPEETPPPPRETSAAASDAPWHDLVCAAIARRGSPRVRASARLRSRIERELGFPPSRTVLRARLWLGAAAAAACVCLLFGPLTHTPAARRAAPLPSAPQATLAAAEERPAKPPLGLAPDASGPFAQPAAIAADAPAPGSRNPLQNPTTPASPGRDSNHYVHHEIASRPADSFPGLAGGGRGGAQSTETGREHPTLESDYYVAGLAAAALRLPSDFNPYDQSSQPVAWTDWLTGHERGMEMSPEELLAINEVRAVLAEDSAIAAGAPAAVMDTDAAAASAPAISASPALSGDEPPAARPPAITTPE